MILYIKEPYLQCDVISCNIEESFDRGDSFFGQITPRISTNIDLVIQGSYALYFLNNNKTDFCLRGDINYDFHNSFISSVSITGDNHTEISIQCDYCVTNNDIDPDWVRYKEREVIIDKLING